jgi:glyoxylase-like metal-dependent hydrolase (beta-lactamase superfamily II)
MKREVIEHLSKLYFDNFEVYIFNAGNFYSDAGAAMGVLPKAIWKKSVQEDELGRMEFATHLMLVKSEKGNILIDTGICSQPDERQKKIYNPKQSTLIENLEICGCKREDIDYVVFTHLHFDHVGGAVLQSNGKVELTFPFAQHIIQKDEWEIALSPDELNKAAYGFDEAIRALENSRNVHIVDGDFELAQGIHLIKTGGHSEGMQIVKLEDNDKVLFYPSDIIPNEINLRLSLTSAYDVCRKETAKAKEFIFNYKPEKRRYVVLNHQADKSLIELPKL